MGDAGFCRNSFLCQRCVGKQTQLFSGGNMHDVQAGICFPCQLHSQFGRTIASLFRTEKRMKSQRYIVSVFFLIFIRIFFDNSLVFAMGGDKQIGSAEYITQAGHPVYQHIAGA